MSNQDSKSADKAARAPNLDELRELDGGSIQNVKGDEAKKVGDKFLTRFTTNGRNYITDAVDELHKMQKDSRFKSHVYVLLAQIYEHAYNRGAEEGTKIELTTPFLMTVASVASKKST
jgi:hypothetical protein